MPHKEYQTVVNKLAEANLVIDALKAENEKLRAALSSHMQSGCNCPYCRDARAVLKVSS